MITSQVILLFKIVQISEFTEIEKSAWQKLDYVRLSFLTNCLKVITIVGKEGWEMFKVPFLINMVQPEI